MKRKVELKEEKGKIELNVAVDITDCLRLNCEEQKEIGKGFTKKRTMRKIGSIPIDVLLALPHDKAVEIMTDDRALKRFLKENPQFRTSEGDI